MECRLVPIYKLEVLVMGGIEGHIIGGTWLAGSVYVILRVWTLFEILSAW